MEGEWDKCFTGVECLRGSGGEFGRGGERLTGVE